MNPPKPGEHDPHRPEPAARRGDERLHQGYIGFLVNPPGVFGWDTRGLASVRVRGMEFTIDCTTPIACT